MIIAEESRDAEDAEKNKPTLKSEGSAPAEGWARFFATLRMTLWDIVPHGDSIVPAFKIDLLSGFVA